MARRSPISEISGSPTDLRVRAIVGGAAGNLTVAGIRSGDRIISVTAFGFTSTAAASAATPTALADLTAQFSVTADNTISNAGGTATTDRIVLVVWGTGRL